MSFIEDRKKEMADIIQATLTKQEFLDAFKEVINHLKRMEQNLVTKVDDKTQTANDALQELQQLHRDTIQQIEADSNSSLSNVKKWALESVGKLFAKGKVDEKLQAMDEKLKTLNEYKLPDASSIALEASKMAQDGLLPLIPIIDKVEEQLPKLGEKIRDGLELLQDEDRLDIKAIKDLQETLDRLEKKIGTGTDNPIYVPNGGGGGGHTMFVYDLSSLLDGSAKTFSVPNFWRVISVQSSSFPNAFRPTTDYTTSQPNSTITFTSEITAATTLAVGQTVLITYSV